MARRYPQRKRQAPNRLVVTITDEESYQTVRKRFTYQDMLDVNEADSDSEEYVDDTVIEDEGSCDDLCASDVKELKVIL